MPYKDIAKRREAVKKSVAKHSERKRAYQKQYMKDHTELYREAARRYNARNKEARNAYSKAYWLRLPLEVRRAKQTSAHLGRFGVDLQWYEEKLAEQNGVCAICGRPPKRIRLAVDHTHIHGHGNYRTASKEQVRGLLCMGCNTLLHSGMSPEWYDSAAVYLRKYTSAQKPLE